MANTSQRFGLVRANSLKSMDPKIVAGPSLSTQKSLLRGGSGSKHTDLNNELLEASERYQGTVPELSTDSNCFHCKDSAASGDANCHICGHTACVRCSKLFHIAERFRTKKDDALVRVCFDCKDMFLHKDKPREGKKEIAPPVWEVTDAYTSCFQCHTAFTKGHQENCRTCGQLFCKNCVTKRTDVPAYFDRQAKSSKGLRVCDRCRYDIIAGATFTNDHQKVREGIESSSVGAVACIPLPSVLTIPQYSAALREFLAQNHALENLNFLFAVEIFRSSGKQDPAQLLPLSKQIYAEFLTPTANQLVNLNAITRDSIEKAVVEGQVKVNLFDAGVTAVMTMVEKDVYRRFATSQESKNLLRESDAATFTHYLNNRQRRLSFSILQRKEDAAFLEAVMAALSFQKMLKTVRKGLAWFTDSIEGSHLIAYLHKEKYASSRPAAIAIAQRLVEGGYLTHTLDSTLEFMDTDHPANIYQAIDASALAKKFPLIPSLFKVRENVFGYLLYRGISYVRLWGAVSVEHMKLFLWRKEDGMHGHSALNLKGASVVFETGGEEDEDEGGGFSGGVKDSLGGKDAALRHGQVYIRITLSRDKALLKEMPETSHTPEFVYLLEEPSLRSRWKKCFEKECKIPVKMVYTAGVSKRAAFVASTPAIAKKAATDAAREAKDASDSFSKPIQTPTNKSATDSFKKSTFDGFLAPVTTPKNAGMMSPNDRLFMASTPKKGIPLPNEEDAPPPPMRVSPGRLPRGVPPPPALEAPPPPPALPVPPPPAYTPPPLPQTLPLQNDLEAPELRSTSLPDNESSLVAASEPVVAASEPPDLNRLTSANADGSLTKPARPPRNRPVVTS